MIQPIFIILFGFLSTTSCILNTSNGYSSTKSFFGNTKGNLINHKHRINKERKYGLSHSYNKIPSFINTPSYTFSKYNNLNFRLSSNDLEQTGLSNLPEESKLIDVTTSDSSHQINYPTQPVIVSTDTQTELTKTKTTTPLITKQPLKEETTPAITTCQLVKSSSLENTVSKFLTKFDLKNKIQTVKKNLKIIKQAIGLFLYPRGASDEVVKYTNWKILERLSLSLSSAIALNVKPVSFTTNDNEKDQSNSIKSKLNGAKMSTVVFSIIFKDVFSRILNYYWFNKVIRLSDNPKAYRLISTLGFSLVTLWDFFINLMSFEPKTVLLAVNHVLKQLFLGSHNVLNQLYYNTQCESYQPNQTKGDLNEHTKLSQLNKINQEKQKDQSIESKESENDKNLKPEPLNQFKDESNFVFDLMGMALGSYTSYLLNTYNSDNVKLLSIVASLLTSNLLTAYVTTLVGK